MKILRFLPLLAFACLSACAPLLGAMTGLGSLPAGPPAAVQQAAAIARGPIDFALHSFDASLYAFDLAMDLKRPAPGSDAAKRIAGLGRKVLAALTLADAAQRAGSATSYEQAFANANVAFDQFKSLLGVPATDLAALDVRSIRQLAPPDRAVILARADSPDAAAISRLLGR
jgi:hypothetical protein